MYRLLQLRKYLTPHDSNFPDWLGITSVICIVALAIYIYIKVRDHDKR